MGVNSERGCLAGGLYVIILAGEGERSGGVQRNPSRGETAARLNLVQSLQALGVPGVDGCPQRGLSEGVCGHINTVSVD